MLIYHHDVIPMDVQTHIRIEAHDRGLIVECSGCLKTDSDGWVPSAIVIGNDGCSRYAVVSVPYRSDGVFVRLTGFDGESPIGSCRILSSALGDIWSVPRGSSPSYSEREWARGVLSGCLDWVAGRNEDWRFPEH